MDDGSFLFLLGLAIATPSGAAVAETQRVISPEAIFYRCFVDKYQVTTGSCKLLEDCPATSRHPIPMNCYFKNSKQYVWCPTPVTRTRVKGCDYARTRPSVSDGTPTEYREFPFMVALGWRSSFDESIHYRCGGSLIASKFVLTAAHCIDFGGQVPVTVRLGGDNLTMGMGVDNQIRRIFMHPAYDEKTAYNDIALLELEMDAPPSLVPVCLWQHAKLAEKELTAVGYGQISFTGLSSSQLLKVDLQHISDDLCQDYYTRELLAEGLAASQLCAGDTKGKGDTCQGDSGGPLLMRSDLTWYVVGVTSLGHGCATGPPSIYTRVSSHLDWIESVVWPEPEVQIVDSHFDPSIFF
ncbi:serine protease snake-like [Drosophila hydei]|uniref:Serine protease snake-like n=1 Tax=Drosophila hydei TaxID=7224 RepID=A0A6J2SSN9_DROHY|nr:serine protease snake-like [Drosophila hydei]